MNTFVFCLFFLKITPEKDTERLEFLCGEQIVVATLIGLATFMGNNLFFSILRKFLVTYTCYPSVQEIFQNGHILGSKYFYETRSFPQSRDYNHFYVIVSDFLVEFCFPIYQTF